MRTKTSSYFESKVRVERTTEDGTQVKMNVLFVVDGMSFSEVESKVSGYVGNNEQGEFDILTESKAKYKEIFFSDNDDENLFYKVTLDFISLDEKSGKEKHSKNIILVQGSSVGSAKKNIEEEMNGTMIDYKIVGITETAIEDFIE